MGVSLATKPEVAMVYTTLNGVVVQSIAEGDQAFIRMSLGDEKYLWYKQRDIVPVREIRSPHGPIMWIHRSILGKGTTIPAEAVHEST